jgi:hypothetical protein
MEHFGEGKKNPPPTTAPLAMPLVVRDMQGRKISVPLPFLVDSVDPKREIVLRIPHSMETYKNLRVVARLVATSSGADDRRSFKDTLEAINSRCEAKVCAGSTGLVVGTALRASYVLFGDDDPKTVFTLAAALMHHALTDHPCQARGIRWECARLLPHAWVLGGHPSMLDKIALQWGDAELNLPQNLSLLRTPFRLDDDPRISDAVADLLTRDDMTCVGVCRAVCSLAVLDPRPRPLVGGRALHQLLRAGQLCDAALAELVEALVVHCAAPPNLNLPGLGTPLFALQMRWGAARPLAERRLRKHGGVAMAPKAQPPPLGWDFAT